MKLATIRHEGGTRAARVDDDVATLLDAGSVRELLDDPQWRRCAEVTGPAVALEDTVYDALVRTPRVFCVGLNYRSHILELGRALPEYPTIFTKLSETLTGASDDILVDPWSGHVDWEAELAFVIGTGGRRIAATDAVTHIAGFAAANDLSIRDFQNRTSQWWQGKNFEATTPVGPWLVTGDEVADAADLAVTCRVDGELVQSGSTSDLLFGPALLVEYLSSFVELRPGDLVLTGTPGGVGHAATPPRYLVDGSLVEVAIEGLGSTRNIIRGGQPLRHS